MSMTLADLLPLRQSFNSQLKEFEQVAASGEIEKMLALRGELADKIAQARDLSTSLIDSDRKEFVPKLDGADRRIAAVLEKALSAQTSNPGAAAAPAKPAPPKLSWSERRTVLSLQQKVANFRKIYSYPQAQAASTKLAVELERAQAKLTGTAKSIVTDLIIQCSFHMQLHNEMQRAVAGTEPVNSYPPIGLHNPSANCWANAFLQTLVNADVDVSASTPLQAAQEGYRAAQLQGSLFAQGVASQKIREALPGASNRSFIQEDVARAFEHFLSSVNLDVPLEQKIETRVRGSDGDLIQATTNTITTRESLLKFPLVAGYDFEALFGSTLKYDSEDDHGFDVKLMEASANLFLQAVRFNYGAGAGKDSSLIQNVPEMFVVPQEYIKDGEAGVLYELRSCIIHLGDSLNSGHYVTLVKKPSGWYLVNDAQTHKVKDEEVPNLLAQGYIFHYAKAE